MQPPLHGVRVVEIAGLGPAPFCAMVLADLGAEVITVDRAAWVVEPPMDVLRRSRRSIAVDLKHPQATEVVLRLCERADVVLEGFRPGVAERLGIGPDVCMARNPALVYGRMTGWGQDGPLATVAGHDINYIALAGALHPIGRNGEAPVAPLNLVGDFGGGGMLLALGVVSALFERTRSGAGQVIDAAMVDGSALLMTMLQEQRATGLWQDRRAANYIDTASPYYDTYETYDGAWMAVGAIEPQFWANLLRCLEIDATTFPDQEDESQWPAMKTRIAAVFRTRTRAEWEAVFDRVDACVTPVLAPGEVANHPHLRARGTMINMDDRVVPAPAPRFSRSPVVRPSASPRPGEHSAAVLTGAGYSSAEIDALLGCGAVRQATGHIRKTP